MKNLQYYKRILAGVACATVLMSNLGVNSQVVFAAENDSEEHGSDGSAAGDAAPEQASAPEPTYDEPEEEITVESLEEEPEAEVPAEEPTPETPVEEPGEAQPEQPTEGQPENPIEFEESGSAGDETSGEDAETPEEIEESGSVDGEQIPDGSETPGELIEDGSTDSEATEEAPETEPVEETEDAQDELWHYIHELDCEDNHEHTDDCYKVIRQLDCEEDHEHTKECYKLIEEEPIEIEESGDAESKTVSYEAHASGIKVKAEAKEEVLPEGATLKAHRIQGTHDLEKVTEELDNSDVEYDDYIALDVYFENSDGDEIEPDGTVQVTFELEDSVLPDDVIADSLSVQHFDESGNSTDVVTVTDSVESSDSTVQANFEVESFSTFTITWSKNNGKDTTTVTVKCVDEDGNELDVLPDGMTDGDKGFELASSNSVKFNTDTNYDIKIDGYTFVKATIGTSEITEIKASYASKSGWKGSGWDYIWVNKNAWYYEITSNNGYSITTDKPTVTLVYKDNNKKTGSTDAKFFLILDGGGTLPLADGKRTDGKTGSSDKPDEYIYSAGISKEKALVEATAVYDINDSDITTKNSATYADNNVAANLAKIPTNQEIVNMINGTGSLRYEVKLNNDGQIEVTNINKNGGQYSISGLQVEDTLYVNWYVIKDESDGWHVDGELLIYTHHEEPAVGSLKVTMMEADKAEEVTVTIPTTSMGDTQSFKVAFYDANGKTSERMMDFSSGSITVSLNKGEHIIISDLPENAVYTVSEKAPSGYNVTYYNNDGSKSETEVTGKIVKDETQAVSIENTMDVVDTGVGADSLPFVATTVAVMIGAMFMLINYKSRRMSR